MNPELIQSFNEIFKTVQGFNRQLETLQSAMDTRHKQLTEKIISIQNDTLEQKQQMRQYLASLNNLIGDNIVLAQEMKQNKTHIEKLQHDKEYLCKLYEKLGNEIITLQNNLINGEKNTPVLTQTHIQNQKFLT